MGLAVDEELCVRELHRSQPLLDLIVGHGRQHLCHEAIDLINLGSSRGSWDHAEVSCSGDGQR